MSDYPKLRSLEIQGLLGRKNIHIDFKDVTVIVGKNGLGKTTVLKTIYALLKQDESELPSANFDTARLNFSNNERASYGYPASSTERESFDSDFEKTLIEIFKSSKVTKGINISQLDIEKLFSDKSEDGIFIKLKQSYQKNASFSANKMTATASVMGYLLEMLKVIYISSMTISANADSNPSLGNGKHKNLLDIAIEDELKTLTDISSERTKRFLFAINNILDETAKKIEVIAGNVTFQDAKSNQPLVLSQLSSGERQLIFILATAANTGDVPTIFLMDEPEISLHLSWQEKILDAIRSINPNMQIIVVTHSPAIVMNGYMDSYIDMKDVITEAQSE